MGMVTITMLKTAITTEYIYTKTPPVGGVFDSMMILPLLNKTHTEQYNPTPYYR